MADSDVRADIIAAFGNSNPEPAPAIDTPASDPGAQPEPTTPAIQPAPAAEDKPSPFAERPRNADGTFAPRPADGQPAGTPAPTAATAPTEPPAPGAQPTPGAERIAPPENWKGAGKLKWERLPKDVQQEIVADYARFGQIESQYRAYQQIVAPRQAQLAALYGSPERALDELFALSDFASARPRDFITWFAQSRGIDLGTAAAPQPQQPAPTDPALAQLPPAIIDKISTLEKKLSDFEGATQQQANDASLNTVKAFCADPAHPFVNDVWEDMVALIDSGRVKRGPNALQEAYDRATWANPTVREHLMGQQREKAQAEQQAKVDAARKAATSIAGSPLPGAAAAPDGAPDRSIGDDLRAAWNAAGGRV